MTREELKGKFRELYTTMKESKDVRNMQVFGEAFESLYMKTADTDTALAEQVLNLLSAVEFNNFVSQEEANIVAAKFINDDTRLTGNEKPSLGPHWRVEDVRSFLSAKQWPTSEKPYYNFPALWLTMNMIYSDFADALSKLMETKDAERIAMASYELAIRKLKDVDNPSFIRHYFDL